jgi:hypothetical protein
MAEVKEPIGEVGRKGRDLDWYKLQHLKANERSKRSYHKNKTTHPERYEKILIKARAQYQDKGRARYKIWYEDMKANHPEKYQRHLENVAAHKRRKTQIAREAREAKKTSEKDAEIRQMLNYSALNDIPESENSLDEKV